jgi:hypothetical protein
MGDRATGWPAVARTNVTRLLGRRGTGRDRGHGAPEPSTPRRSLLHAGCHRCRACPPRGRAPRPLLAEPRSTRNASFEPVAGVEPHQPSLGVLGHWAHRSGGFALRNGAVPTANRGQQRKYRTWRRGAGGQRRAVTRTGPGPTATAIDRLRRCSLLGGLRGVDGFAVSSFSSLHGVEAGLDRGGGCGLRSSGGRGSRRAGWRHRARLGRAVSPPPRVPPVRARARGSWCRPRSTNGLREVRHRGPSCPHGSDLRGLLRDGGPPRTVLANLIKTTSSAHPGTPTAVVAPGATAAVCSPLLVGVNVGANLNLYRPARSRRCCGAGRWRRERDRSHPGRRFLSVWRS